MLDYFLIPFIFKWQIHELCLQSAVYLSFKYEGKKKCKPSIIQPMREKNTYVSILSVTCTLILGTFSFTTRMARRQTANLKNNKANISWSNISLKGLEVMENKLSPYKLFTHQWYQDARWHAKIQCCPLWQLVNNNFVSLVPPF